MERERSRPRLTFRKARDLVRRELGTGNRLERDPWNPGAFRMWLGQFQVQVRKDGKLEDVIELTVSGAGYGTCVELFDIDTLSHRTEEERARENEEKSLRKMEV